MPAVNHLRIAARAFRAHPLRAALNLVGIAIGVAALVAMLAIGRGARTQVDAQLRAIGTDVQLLVPASTVAAGVREGAGTMQTLTEADARALAAEVPGIVHAAPVVRGWVQVIAGARNWSTMLYASTNDYFLVRDWQVVAGRAFEPDELAEAAKVAVIGQTVATELFGAGVPLESLLGETIRIRTVPLTIVGVLDRKGQSLGGYDMDDAVFAPIHTGRTRLIGGLHGRIGRIHSVLLKFDAEADAESVAAQAVALIRQRHRVADGRPDPVTLRDLTATVEAQRAAIGTVSSLLAAIAAVSLIVGGVGIMNTMLVTVTERTREIGLRMAVGARSRDIRAQFLVESGLLAAAGGALGIAAGVLLGELVGDRQGWVVRHEPATMTLAFGFAALVGVACGWYPARKAARLTPIEALRHE